MRQATGRFLIDLNVGERVARALRHAGCDILFVGDTDPRMRDVDILRLAVQEGRVIITLDTDFGNLVYHSGEPHIGVLLLRMPAARSDEKVSVVSDIVSRYGSQLPGHFCVYRNGRLRVRP